MTAEAAAAPAEAAEQRSGAASGASEGAEKAMTRRERASAIVQKNVLWALGLGVLPIPIVDLFTVTGVEIKLLSELSELYGLKFSEGVAKKVVGSLIAGVGGVTVGAMFGASLAKFVPYVGTALGIMAMPVTAGAVTHALGRVFIMHFESGGTLLDLDPDAMRAHFRREFEGAKDVVVQLQKDEQAKG